MIARSLLLAAIVLASAGCAHTADNDWRCRLNEAPSLPYSQMSRTFQVDNLPESTLVAAHFYSLRATRATVAPCSNLAIVKEIHVRTAPRSDLRLREHRRLIDARGRVIAEHDEDISRQITVTATYRGVLALNIPAGMRPGNYRLVSTIYVDGVRAGDADAESITLNEASTTFAVAAAEIYPNIANNAAAKTAVRGGGSRPTISKNRIP